MQQEGDHIHIGDDGQGEEDNEAGGMGSMM